MVCVAHKKKAVSFDTAFKNNPMNISKNEFFFRILSYDLLVLKS